MKKRNMVYSFYLIYMFITMFMLSYTTIWGNISDSLFINMAGIVLSYIFVLGILLEYEHAFFRKYIKRKYGVTLQRAYNVSKERVSNGAIIIYFIFDAIYCIIFLFRHVPLIETYKYRIMGIVFSIVAGIAMVFWTNYCSDCY